MKASTTFLCIILFSFGAIAQSGNPQILGVVEDESGEPAQYATVALYQHADSNLIKADHTGDNGHFNMTGMNSGSYFIEITMLGYHTFRQAVSVIAERKTDLGRIILKTSSAMLDEVVVKARRPMIEVKADKTIFNVENTVNSTGSNALELLRKSPGVIVDNNDNLMLMGKSGVKVYIDGRPSPLSSEDLANYLQSVQADEIESIEIITNPGSRYEAEGNAGIINIRMRKNKNFGTNGSLALGFNQGKHAQGNGSLRLNHREENINLYGSYAANLGTRSGFMNVDRQLLDNLFLVRTTNQGDYLNHNYRAGLDWFVGKNQTLGILVDGSYNDWDWANNSRTELLLDGSTDPGSVLVAANLTDGYRNNINGNLNYQLNGENGNSLTLDGNIGRFRNRGNSYQPNRYYDGNETQVTDERIFAAETPTDIELYTFKADFETEVLGTKLEIGGKYSYVTTDNVYRYYNVENEARTLDPDRSNQFEYTENVNAGYLNLQKKFDQFGLSFGLRMENTSSRGVLTSQQQTGDEDVRRDYTDFFPSGGITYQVNDKNSLRLNYSRRIDRPSYQSLNPFEFKLNELAFRKGNPFLNPQYTQNIELSHTFNYSLTTTIRYSVTNDLMTNITDTLNNQASFITLVNLDKQRVYSVNVSYPFSPVKWWNVYANVNFYRLENKAEFEPGKLIDVDANAVSIYTQHGFTLPGDFRLEVSGVYNSPGVWGGNFETDSYWFVDMGIQKKLFGERANLKITFSDIFKSMEWRGVNSLGALQIDASGGHDSRQLRLNLTYSFGNQQVKASRQRKTGLEEERNRIDTSNN